jgi:DNA mismatch repair ATPase MutS
MSYIENGSGGSGGSDEYSVTFLYKLVEGMADRSFGLNVAKLAGLPPKVLSTEALMSL